MNAGGGGITRVYALKQSSEIENQRAGGQLRLPNFFIIGAMRAGTTTLWELLRSHPDVYMPDLKEPSFFAKEFNWRNGLRWYRSLFADAGLARSVGEASTVYTNARFNRGVPRRIAHLIPNAKLIYIIRNPIDRVVSEYYYWSRLTAQRRPLNEAVLDERLLSKSRYWLQIENYLKFFKPSQLLVITTDDLSQEPAAVVRQAYQFLNVEPTWRPPNLDTAVENRHTDIRSFSAVSIEGAIDPDTEELAERTRSEILKRLRADLTELRTFIGPRFPPWDPS